MQIIDGPLAVIGWINSWISRIFRNIAAALVAGMVGVVLLQVVFRYVLNNALSWSEEVAIYLMVWMTFLVAPIAYRESLNVALNLFTGWIKGRVLYLLMIVLDVLVMVLIVYLFREAVDLIDRNQRVTARTIDITMAYVFMALPIGYVAMFLAGIERILKEVRNLIEPPKRPDAPAPAGSQLAQSS